MSKQKNNKRKPPTAELLEARLRFTLADLLKPDGSIDESKARQAAKRGLVQRASYSRDGTLTIEFFSPIASWYQLDRVKRGKVPRGYETAA